MLGVDSAKSPQRCGKQPSSLEGPRGSSQPCRPSPVTLTAVPPAALPLCALTAVSVG